MTFEEVWKRTQVAYKDDANAKRVARTFLNLGRIYLLHEAKQDTSLITSDIYAWKLYEALEHSFQESQKEATPIEEV